MTEGHPNHPHSSFDEAYQGTPPWDIGRPQSAIVALEEAGRIVGEVLDAGCGTGENALFLASRGHKVTGIDGSPRAIEKARSKTAERGIDASFQVADALHLQSLEHAFHTVIDVGLFHSFNDDDRTLWVPSLGSVLAPGGRYYAVTFSDKVRFEGGPRRIRREEFGQVFTNGWRVVSVEETKLDTARDVSEVPAWLATIERA